MKNPTVLLFILTTFTAFGQKQKEKDMQAKIDTLTRANQSLTNSNKALASKSDSISKELTTYFGLYTVIKEKVVKMDFNPAKMSRIIDSLRAGRDSAINLSGASSVLLRDSIKSLQKMNDSLRKDNEGLRYAVNLMKGGSGINPTDPKDFTGTWNLKLRKVKIVGESPRTGIVEAPAPPAGKTPNFLEVNSVNSITFLDKEFVELTFSNQEKAKCYYVISDFSKTNPYFIDFKGTKADFRMYFTNTVTGPRISFQIPGVEGMYYFGEMTK